MEEKRRILGALIESNVIDDTGDDLDESLKEVPTKADFVPQNSCAYQTKAKLADIDNSIQPGAVKIRGVDFQASRNQSFNEYDSFYTEGGGDESHKMKKGKSFLALGGAGAIDAEIVEEECSSTFHMAIAVAQPDSLKQANKVSTTETHRRNKCKSIMFVSSVLLLICIAIGTTLGVLLSGSSPSPSPVLSEKNTTVSGGVENPAFPTPSPSLSPSFASSLARSNLTILEWLSVEPSLSTFRVMFDNSWLHNYRIDGDKITVFAMRDAHFTNLVFQYGLNWIDIPWLGHALDLVMNHVLYGQDLVAEQLNGTLQSWNGQVHELVEGKTVDGKPIHEPDAYIASDGIVHLVTEAIFPRWFQHLMDEYTEEHYPEWYELFERTQLVNLLQGDGPINLLIPKPEALESLLKNETVMGDFSLLSNILRCHVILPGFNIYVAPVWLEETRRIYVNETIVVENAQSSEVNVTLYGAAEWSFDRHVTIDEVLIVEEDIFVRNGAIQIMDQVLAHWKV